jgi:hypothetical protein
VNVENVANVANVGDVEPQEANPPLPDPQFVLTKKQISVQFCKWCHKRKNPGNSKFSKSGKAGRHCCSPLDKCKGCDYLQLDHNPERGKESPNPPPPKPPKKNAFVTDEHPAVLELNSRRQQNFITHALGAEVATAVAPAPEPNLNIMGGKIVAQASALPPNNFNSQLLMARMMAQSQFLTRMNETLQPMTTTTTTTSAPAASVPIPMSPILSQALGHAPAATTTTTTTTTTSPSAPVIPELLLSRSERLQREKDQYQKALFFSEQADLLEPQFVALIERGLGFEDITSIWRDAESVIKRRKTVVENQ